MTKLENANYKILQTQTKELACKTTGDGAMAEPLQIFYATARELLQDDFWLDRSVVISGGGTLEKIDDVRYISNFSSGKMASALATALYFRGANIKLVASRFESDLAQAIEILNVQSSKEMQTTLNETLASLKQNAQKMPYLFMAAAVSDYVPNDVKNGKIKKENMGEHFSLEMKQNIDILSSLDKNGVKVIGFKAEMDAKSATENATKMLKNKNLDAVCLNVLKDSSSFGSETNAIDFITQEKTVSLRHDSKLNIAFEIANNAKSIKE